MQPAPPAQALPQPAGSGNSFGVAAASLANASVAGDMKSLLAEIRELNARSPSPFDNDLRARDIKAFLDKTTDVQKAIFIRGDYAGELLKAGRGEEAAAEFEKLDGLLKKHIPNFYSQQRIFLKISMAVACMRMGERQNDLDHHSNESSLFPISGGGIHKKQDGAAKAMSLLLEILKEQPENIPAAWLLNIAAMTLGRFPDGVPEPFRLPPDALRSDYDIKRFPDIADDLELAVNELGGGAVMDDFNGDGRLDLMASSSGLNDQIRLFINDGNGGFVDRTEAAGLKGITGGVNLIQADYDNDNDIDVLVLRGAWRDLAGLHPNSLLRNDGKGAFEDVTRESGVLSLHPTSSAAWLDFDNDGELDLYIVNETLNDVHHPCELYRNLGDGRFENVAEACGVAFIGFFKAVVAGDYDNDGRVDLYLSTMMGANKLLRNEGPSNETGAWKFSDVAETAGVTEPKFSFPCGFFDYDNDGWLDLFVSDYNIGAAGAIPRQYFGKKTEGEGAKLYRNKGDGTFENVAEQLGVSEAMLAMGANFGDLDNDGWLDFHLGTGAPDMSFLFPNRMFRNNAGKEFQDVTTSGGFGHLQKGAAVAFGDLDNDGDQDVYAVMGGAFSGDNYFNTLFQNPGHGGAWIKLRLRGDKSNRAAIGARLKLTIEENGVERAIHRVVGSGGSLGASPLLQEIGLGRAALVKKLEITWPASGTTQKFDNVAVGMLHTITEGRSTMTSDKPIPIAFVHQH